MQNPKLKGIFALIAVFDVILVALIGFYFYEGWLVGEVMKPIKEQKAALAYVPKQTAIALGMLPETEVKPYTEHCLNYTFQTKLPVMRKETETNEAGEPISCTAVTLGLQELTLSEGQVLWQDFAPKEDLPTGLGWFSPGWLDSVKSQRNFELIDSVMKSTPEAAAAEWLPGERYKTAARLRLKAAIMQSAELDNNAYRLLSAPGAEAYVLPSSEKKRTVWVKLPTQKPLARLELEQSAKLAKSWSEEDVNLLVASLKTNNS